MSRKKLLVFILFVQMLLLLINTISSTSNPMGSDVSSQLPDDTPAPNFSLTDIVTNDSFSLTDFQGKVVILDLFATWCGPCVDAIPKIREIYLSYSADELIIISIDVSDEDEQLVKDFIYDHKMEWLVAFDNDSIVSTNYGSGYIPTLYVIDQDQVVTYSEIGFNLGEVLNALDHLGLESTRPISPNGSFNGIPSLDIIPTIFIAGIGFMVIFIIGAVLYGRYQQRKQAAAYQARYGFSQEQTALTGYEKPGIKICPNCNQSVTTGAKFCMNCGSGLRHGSN
ncbi:MAG: redoxin family protein [Candidatus Hodarchaeota archaeon]